MKDVTKLGNIADIYDGPHATPKKIENGKYFLSISSLDNGSLDLSKSAFISDKDFIKWTKRVQPQKGDLLFSYETRLGEAALMPDNLQACLGRRMGLLRPKKDKVIPQYLLFAYLSPEFQKVIRKNTIKGATVDRIALNELGNFPIYIPDLKTQQSIAAVLSALDKKIALNKQINARLEEMAKTLYDYWFVQFDFPDANGKPYKSSGGEMVFDETLKREIPKGWEVKSLWKVANFKNGINYSIDDVGGTNSYIVNVRDVSNSSIFIHEYDLDMISLANEKLQAYQIKENTILVTRSGNPGATRLLVNTNKLVVYCGFIISVEPKENNLLNLLFWFLKNQEGRISDISAGTVLKNVSQDILKRGYIVIPDETILGKFNDFNRNIFSEICSIVKQNHQLTQLRDFLLPMLMNGQVSVAE